jgi:hypothetical protein
MQEYHCEDFLSQEKLKELLEYNPDTGVFIRKIRSGKNVKIGDVAGCLTNHGYISIRLFNRPFYVHRLVWLYIHGIWPEHDIDHINGIRKDNRLINLREAARFQNMQNVYRARSNNISGYLGVSYDRVGRNYYAQITLNGVVKHLGHFKTAEEASERYLSEKVKLHEYYNRI